MTHLASLKCFNVVHEDDAIKSSLHNAREEGECLMSCMLSVL